MTEENLKKIEKDFDFLTQMKKIKLSSEKSNQIWNKIELKIDLEKDKKKNLYEITKLYTPYLLIAAVITLIIIVTVLFNNQENTLPKNAISIEMGGIMIPTENTNFQVAKSTKSEEYVSLKNGELDIYVVPLKKGEAPQYFELETKDGIVSVKGTKFKVTVDKSGTNVLVKEGTVWVQPKGEGREKIVLKKGESTKILPLDTFLEKNKKDGTKAYMNKNYPIAKEKLGKYLLNKKDDYNIITLLARIAEYEKRYTNAISLYEKVLEGGSNTEKETAWVAIAVLLKNSNQTKKANKMFLNYLKKFPNGVFKDDVYKELKINH